MANTPIFAPRKTVTDAGEASDTSVVGQLNRILLSLTSPHRAVLMSIAENDRPQALAQGRIPSISAAEGNFIVAVNNAAQGAWLDALFVLRRALLNGFDINRAREVLALIHAGIDAELRTGRPAFALDLFKPSTLALVRWCEALVNYPWVRVLGVETEIVSSEQRPVAELQEVFGLAFLAEVPPEGPQRQAYLDGMLHTATNEALATGQRGWALVSMAGFALQAGDLPAAVRLVGQAVDLVPTDDAAGTSAVFLWVVLNAAAREKKLLSVGAYPNWNDVVMILRGALGCEGRHPVETPEQVAAFNERLNAMDRTRQS